MTIAIYSRKSKSTTSGESIKNQIDLCREYAYQHYVVDAIIVYEDDGFSGSHTKRPEFQKMLEDAKNKTFNMLICYRLDRISRNVLDFSTILECLSKYHIEFVSIRDHFDTSSPMGRAMMYIASVFAQLERETIAERIQDNMYKLAESGRWLGGITPLGYRSLRIFTGDGKSISILETVPEEIPKVRAIFHTYAQCKTLTKLQDYTRSHGIYTRRNKNFSLSALKNLLSNPVYMAADEQTYRYFTMHNATFPTSLSQNDFDGSYGLMAYNKHHEEKHRITRKSMDKWIIAIGRHQPLITSKEWIATQSLLRHTNRLHHPSNKDALLFPLLQCKHCHIPLDVKGVYREERLQYLYYQCKQRKDPMCGLITLNGFKAQEQLLHALDAFIPIAHSDTHYLGLSELLTPTEKDNLLHKLISSMTWDGSTLLVKLQ